MVVEPEFDRASPLLYGVLLWVGAAWPRIRRARLFRELYQMRVENINWHDRVIFNPSSKTEKGRRFIPISDRAMEILKARCAGRTEGWVFESRYKGKHIGAAWVNRQWVEARRAAKLPADLVLYCARHDFGSYVPSKIAI